MDISIRKASLDDARELALLLRGIGWFEAFNSGQIDELAVRAWDLSNPLTVNRLGVSNVVAFANLLNDWSMVVVLSNDAIYRAYCRRVAWHLVPGVF